MANEQNDNTQVTQIIGEEETRLNKSPNFNEADGSYDSSILLEKKDQNLADTIADKYNKPHERAHRQSRTVSFSEDVCDLKTKDVVNKDDKTVDIEGNKPTADVEYDDSNVPYDRGWAWVVDFSCFVLFFVYISHDHWHSVLLTDYMQEFSIPITVLTIMMSVGTVLYCVATQVSSNVLVVRYSIRVVITCAAILNVAATLLFAGVPNIAVFFVANFIKYTVKGVTLIATLTLVGYYFRRRRGLATTLGLLGVGSSAMCAPPLIRFLRDEYGFQGCFLILAGLEMHAILAALLLRPISTYTRKKVYPKHLHPEKEETYPLIATPSADCSNSLQLVLAADHLQQIAIPATGIAEISIAEAGEPGSNSVQEGAVHLMPKVINKLDNNSEITDHVSESKGTKSNSNGGADNVMMNEKIQVGTYLNIHTGNDGADTYLNVSDIMADSGTLKRDAVTDNIKIDSMPSGTKEFPEEASQTLQIPNADTVVKSNGQLKAKTSETVVSYPTGKGSICSDHDMSQISNFIRSRSLSNDIYLAEIAAPKAPRTSIWSLVTSSAMGSMLNIAHVVEPGPATELAKPSPRFWVKELIDIKLIKNYLAMMIALNYILVNMGAFTIVYLPTYAKRVGVSPQKAAILLTITGCMDMVGRLGFGFLADLKLCRPHLIIAVISAAIGTVTQFMPLFTSFETLIVFSVAHGLFAGVGMNLTTVVVVDILGIQHLGKMLPMCSMFNSISFFIQHNIQGALIESTGNFTATFHYIGASFLVNTCILLAEPFFRKLQAAKEKTLQTK
ncbi:hypothetical protein BsWGS_03270 [Bradybaena similaris]